MEKGVRACTAYVAGCLISGRRSSSVYDYRQSTHVLFSGTVDRRQIAVFDHNDGAHFSGNWTGSGYSLYHYGQGGYVDLTVSDNQFSGYDYRTGSHFDGNVSGTTISVYDYGKSTWFQYSL